MNTKRTIFKNLIFIFIVGIFIFLFNLNSTAQELSFTVSSTTLTESGITITNNSNSIPIGYRFRWEVSGGAIYCDSIGRPENSFEKNNTTFMIYPVTKFNSDAETITLTLKLMNQAGVIQSTTPNSASLTYNPLTFLPQACNVSIPNIPCNIVCNPGFEVASDVTGGKQLNNASPWMNGFYYSSNAYVGNEAELYTFANSNTAWSTGYSYYGVPTILQNAFGSQLPSTTYGTNVSNNNYGGFVARSINLPDGSHNGEFILAKLTSTINSGSTYAVNFEYSLAEKSKIGCNFNVFIIYTSSITSSDIYNAVWGLSSTTNIQQVVEINPSAINQLNNNQWSIFNGSFTAPSGASGDAYILITGGNNTQPFFNASSYFDLAYYFIDNVVVKENFLGLPTTINTCSFPYTINTSAYTNFQTGTVLMWFDQNSNLISNSTSLSCAISQAGTYKLIAISPNGCIQTSYFTVNNVSTSGTLSNQTILCGTGTTLTVGNPLNVSSYNWYKNGVPINPNPNSPTYTTGVLNSNTNYMVLLSNSNGCPNVWLPCTVTVNNQTLSTALAMPDFSKSWVNSISPTTIKYDIISPNPAFIYQWTIVSGTATVAAGSLNSNSVTITWNSSITPCPLIGQIKLKVIDGNCHYNEKQYDVYDLNYCDKVQITNANQIKDNITITAQSDLSLSQYYFIGTIKIATNITLSAKTIWMAPEAKIVVLPGCILTINNNTILTNTCGGMWDGIYLDNTGATAPKIIMDYSNISYAVNGIVSSHGAKFSITNSTFWNNYISIMVNNYKRASAYDPNLASLEGSIYGCKFNFGSDMYTINHPNQDYYNLNCPYQNIPKYTGILVDNVESFVIGDKNKAANEFGTAEHGIVIQSSSIDVVNCDFGNIKTNLVGGTSIINGGAIHITGNAMGNDKIRIGLPNDLAAQNNFYICGIGVYSEKNRIQIYKNTFNNSSIGILVTSYAGTPASNISDNYFNTVYHGIIVNNTTLNGGLLMKTINITNNMFGSGSLWGSLTTNAGSSNMAHGIWVTNVNNKCIIKANLIKMNGSGFGGNSRFGIRVENCDKVLVENNSVVYANTTGIAGTVGLLFNKTQQGSIIDNTFQNLDKGIECNGNLNQSIFKCNGLFYNNIGINFNQATFTSISDQGSINPSNPYITHNKWLLPVGNPNAVKMLGTVQNPTQWYYNPNVPTGAAFTPSNNVFNIAIQQVGINPSCSTNAYVIPPLVDPENMTAEQRDQLYRDVTEGIEYTELMQEFQTYDNRWLYELLDNNPDLLFLNPGDDQRYIDWYNSMKTANIGRFKNVLDYIELGDYAAATTLNTAIIPESDLFNYLKQVLNIYLVTWCQNVYTFTEEQELTLNTIAYLTPEEAGDAVYTARLMLDIDPVLDGSVTYRLKPSSKEADSKVKLYPNPVKDQLTIEFLNGKELNNGSLEIFDLSGRKVLTTNFSSPKSKIMVNIHSLENGMYLYKIESSDGQMFTGKLNKLK